MLDKKKAKAKIKVLKKGKDFKMLNGKKRKVINPNRQYMDNDGNVVCQECKGKNGFHQDVTRNEHVTSYCTYAKHDDGSYF